MRAKCRRRAKVAGRQAGADRWILPPLHHPSERRTARLQDLIVAFGPLAVCLASAAHGSGMLTCALLRGLLVVTAQLHFTIDAFALQLLLESAEGLIDIVVANDDLHGRKAFDAQRRNGELPSLYGAVARKPTPEMHRKAQIALPGTIRRLQSGNFSVTGPAMGGRSRYLPDPESPIRIGSGAGISRFCVVPEGHGADRDPVDRPRLSELRSAGRRSAGGAFLRGRCDDRR